MRGRRTEWNSINVSLTDWPDALREMREWNCWSRARASRETGVPAYTLKAYETRRVGISIERLARLAKAYGYKIVLDCTKEMRDFG